MLLKIFTRHAKNEVRAEKILIRCSVLNAAYIAISRISGKGAASFARCIGCIAPRKEGVMPKMSDIELYPEDGWDPPKIIESLANRKTVKEYAMILHNQDLKEDGSLKKPHYHLFLNYGSSNPKIKDIASWFDIPEHAVEKVHSNKYLTLRYYLHLDSPEKHLYKLEDMIANFDIKEYFQKEESKLSKSDLIKKCADGTITRRNFKDHIDSESYVKYQSVIEAAWDYNQLCKEIETGNHRAAEVIWIYGETETGKTTCAIMFAEELGFSYCVTASGTDPFSNYKGEDVLIIDDLRPDRPFSFSELLKILDPNFLTPVHSRYKNKIIYASYIFVTNPYSPEEFYKHMPDNPFEDKSNQLYRRISQAWEFTKDKIHIYCYDHDTNRFCLCDEGPNPVGKKVASMPIQKPKPAIEVLDKMLDDIQKPEQQSPIPGFTLVTDDEIDF